MSVKPTNPQINWSHPLARGLVAAWAFEDGGGSVLRDVSGHGNDGTLTNMDPGTDWVRGPHGGALDFDGSNDYGSVDGLNFVYAITVAAWALTTTTGVSPHSESELVSQDINSPRSFDAGIRFGSTQLAVFRTNTNVTTLTGSATVTLNEWHHFAYTYQFISNGSSVMRIYLDGVLDGETTSAVGPINATTRPVIIGGREYTTSKSNWQGQIADVRLYDRALSANEVLDLYANPWDLYEPAIGIHERYYRSKSFVRAIGTGLHAIEAGGVYGAPGINSGLHAIETGVVTS